MLPEISKIKGVHPGAILRRAIKTLGLKNNEFAFSINEHAQTLSAILNEKRGVNPKLSIKLGKEFGVDEDYFMLIQASYDVKKAFQEQPNPIDFKKFRKSLFWDADISKIDGQRDKKAIIKRILERGNETEIQEIISLYGLETIKKEMQNVENDFLPSFKENLLKYGIINAN